MLCLPTEHSGMITRVTCCQSWAERSCAWSWRWRLSGGWRMGVPGRWRMGVPGWRWVSVPGWRWVGVPGWWWVSVPGWRWVGSLSFAHTVPSIKNLMVLTCAAALAPTGTIVKGVVSMASCVGMRAQPLTLTSIFVELFSIMAVPLLALTLALIPIPPESSPAPLVVATLTFTSLRIHLLWADTGRWWAHASAGFWVNNFISMTLHVLWTLTATREDAKNLVVILPTIVQSIIPDILRYASFAHALTRLRIKNITS